MCQAAQHNRCKCLLASLFLPFAPPLIYNPRVFSLLGLNGTPAGHARPSALCRKEPSAFTRVNGNETGGDVEDEERVAPLIFGEEAAS